MNESVKLNVKNNTTCPICNTDLFMFIKVNGTSPIRRYTSTPSSTKPQLIYKGGSLKDIDTYDDLERKMLSFDVDKFPNTIPEDQDDRGSDSITYINDQEKVECDGTLIVEDKGKSIFKFDENEQENHEEEDNQDNQENHKEEENQDNQDNQEEEDKEKQEDIQNNVINSENISPTNKNDGQFVLINQNLSPKPSPPHSISPERNKYTILSILEEENNNNQIPPPSPTRQNKNELQELPIPNKISQSETIIDDIIPSDTEDNNNEQILNTTRSLKAQKSCSLSRTVILNDHLI